MIDDRRSLVPFFFWSSVALVAALVIPGGQGRAQAPASQVATVVPPPPGQARQDPTDPERAHDTGTGQDLLWDCVNSTWVDSKTGKALGFQGARGRGGEVIPPPPRIETEPGSLRGAHQAQQDLIYPEQAHDAETGQNLFWDNQSKTWKDGATGKALGFQGQRASRPCPQPPKPQVSLRPGNAGFGTEAYGVSGDGFHWYALLKYERRFFYKWKDVSGNSPSVVTNDVTSSTNGAGAYVGAKLGPLPIWGMVGGYYAGGLATDATLLNGHRVHNDVNNYAFGGGVRLLAGGTRRTRFWAWLAGLREWNDDKFDEYDKFNVLIFSEKRTHKSWTGEYGVGGTYWAQPRIGLDLGISYNGQFNSRNADENVRVGIGLIVQ